MKMMRVTPMRFGEVEDALGEGRPVEVGLLADEEHEVGASSA